MAVFLSRATGFGVHVGVRSSESTETGVIFTLKFRDLPPKGLLDPLDATGVRSHSALRPLQKGGSVEFFLPDSREQNPQPRKVLEILAPFCPVLVLKRGNREQTHASRDVVSVGLRGLISALLTIPILVLVWATELPQHGSKLYTSVQLALSTGVLATALPIYTASFRSIIYLDSLTLECLWLSAHSLPIFSP